MVPIIQQYDKGKYILFADKFLYLRFAVPKVLFVQIEYLWNDREIGKYYDIINNSVIIIKSTTLS